MLHTNAGQWTFISLLLAHALLPAPLFWAAVATAFAALWVFSSRGMTVRQKIMISTWAPQEEGVAKVKSSLTLNKTMKFMADYKERTGCPITITHVVGKAIGMVLRESPLLNAHIVLGRLVKSDDCDVCFLVNVEGGKNLWVHTVRKADEKSLGEIVAELAQGADRVRTGRDQDYQRMMELAGILPTFLLRPMSQFVGFLSAIGVNMPAIGIRRRQGGSVTVTSVGQFGIDEAYPPFTPFMWNSVIALVGAIKDKPVAVDGKVEIHPRCNLMFTIDHRFIDGATGSKMLRRVKELVENPELITPQ